MKHACNFQDLTGQQFGELTVIELMPREDKSYTRWKCQCSCGAETVVAAGNLRKPKGIKSCKDCASAKRKAPYSLQEPEYAVWNSMKQRCNNPNSKSYPRYGGKGTKVCQRWLDSYTAFVQDMGRRPSDNHTIDRIDSAGNYEPGNCRWLPAEQQSANRGNVIQITYQGKTQILKHWAEELGLNYWTVHSRWWRDGKRTPEELFA